MLRTTVTPCLLTALAVAGPGVGVARADVAAVGAGDCTHVVARDGSDAAAGTAAAPWRHVDWAVDHVGPGAVICVRAGTYVENVTFARAGEDGRPITLAADPAAAAPVIIDGTIGQTIDGQRTDNPCECAPALSITDRSHLRITGLTIRNRGNFLYTVGGGPRGCGVGVARECAAAGVRVVANSPAAVVADVIVDRCTFEQIRSAYDDSLGTAIAVAATEPDRRVVGLQIVRNLLRDTDTTSVILHPAPALADSITSGLIGMTGNVHDFLVEHNTFELDHAYTTGAVPDPDALGMDIGGNQGTNAHPERGVIADNEFRSSGSARAITFAVYAQAARRLVVEGNRFVDVGRGVGVLTEPACDTIAPVLAGQIWIRHNTFVRTRIAELTTGAFDNTGVSDCPAAAQPHYMATEDVWFTDNTVYREGAGAGATLSIPATSRATLGGDVRVRNNLIIARDPRRVLTLEPEVAARPGAPPPWPEALGELPFGRFSKPGLTRGTSRP